MTVWSHRDSHRHASPPSLPRDADVVIAREDDSRSLDLGVRQRERAQRWPRSLHEERRARRDQRTYLLLACLFVQLAEAPDRQSMSTSWNVVDSGACAAPRRAGRSDSGAALVIRCSRLILTAGFGADVERQMFAGCSATRRREGRGRRRRACGCPRGAGTDGS